MKRWRLISSKTAFHNQWVHVECRQYRKPDGEILDFFVNKGANIVSVLGITDDRKVIVVEQYRPAVNTITIDLPGGAIKKHEAPITAAKREFQEETGLKINKLRKLVSVYHDSGKSNQKKHFFVGNVYLMNSQKTNQLHDGCRSNFVSFDQLLAEIKRDGGRRIYEPSLILAILLYTSCK